MHVTYACPSCHVTLSRDRVETTPELACPDCAAVVSVPADAIGWVGADGGPAAAGAGRVRLRRCLVCPGSELFARKDFPQRLGVAIVVAGFAASCVTWAWRLLIPTFAILFGTAAIDVVLYFLMPECLTCYRCGARYRGDGVADDAGGFDLETHEKHRQQQARSRERAAARAADGRRG
jgi:DNA-directed RNA polymerase subunit RPC12/RpoP